MIYLKIPFKIIYSLYYDFLSVLCELCGELLHDLLFGFSVYPAWVIDH